MDFKHEHCNKENIRENGRLPKYSSSSTLPKFEPTLQSTKSCCLACWMTFPAVRRAPAVSQERRSARLAGERAHTHTTTTTTTTTTICTHSHSNKAARNLCLFRSWGLIQGKEKDVPKQAQELFCLQELGVSSNPRSGLPGTPIKPFLIERLCQRYLKRRLFGSLNFEEADNMI